MTLYPRCFKVLKKKLFSTMFWESFYFFFSTLTCFWDLKQKLTRLWSQKVLRLWLEDVLISLQISYNFRLYFQKKYFFVKPKWFQNSIWLVFVKPKWFHSFFKHFGGIFFCRKFQGLKIAVFWPKFTICWVSALTW